MVELSEYTESPIPTMKTVVLRFWGLNSVKSRESAGDDELPTGHLHTLPRCRPGDVLIAYPAIAKGAGQEGKLIFEIGAQIMRDRLLLVFPAECAAKSGRFSLTEVALSASYCKMCVENGRSSVVPASDAKLIQILLDSISKSSAKLLKDKPKSPFINCETTIQDLLHMR